MEWHTGSLFSLPGILHFHGSSSTSVQAFELTSGSDIHTYWFRLALQHEMPKLFHPEFVLLIPDADLSKHDFALRTWDEDETERLIGKIADSYKDLDDKIADLHKQAEQAKREILAGQELIREGVKNVSDKIGQMDAESEKRDLRLQSLILHQGREIKNLLTNDGQGKLASNLDKWWPKKQEILQGHVKRRSSDGSLLVDRLHAELRSSKTLLLNGMGGIGKTSTAKCGIVKNH